MKAEQNNTPTSQKPSNLSSLFSKKWFVGLVMVVLGVGLALNVTYVASQGKQTQNRFQTQSYAIKGFAQNIPLPSLPAGCFYKNVGDGFFVECSNVIPTNTLPTDLKVTIPPIPNIAVPLPNLPPKCKYESTTNGMSLNCTIPSGYPQISIPPIPTVMVPLPSLPKECQKETTPEGGLKIRCSTPPIPSIPTINLPSLPAGCKYEQLPSGSTIVKCAPQITVPPIPSVNMPTIVIPTTSVVLPTLPNNCFYETTPNGTVVKCSIPTEPAISEQPPSPEEISPTEELPSNQSFSEQQPKGIGRIFSNLLRPFTSLFGSLFGKR